VQNSNGRWFPKQKQTLYDYRVNRKEANAVRKSVSQFKDYLAGVIKLKAEEVTTNFGARYETRFNVVKVTYGELIEVFGKVQDVNNGCRPDVKGWDKLSEKPKHHTPEHRAEAWANYHEKTANFFDLVRNDQDDNARHQNYWIAFNALMVQEQSLYWRDSMETQVTLGTDQFDKVLDRILFKMFSDKVFVQVPLPEGKVPTGKYDEYVMSEED
jgi:hypothetical protein